MIFGTGEDIDLEFPAALLPTLPKGWAQDYVLYANGFVEDMDFYEASPYTVAKIPFHGMRNYPSQTMERDADDPSRMQYELDWNGRSETGDSAQNYRFHYVPRVMQAPDLSCGTALIQGKAAEEIRG